MSALPFLAITLGDPAATGRGDPRSLVEAIRLAAAPARNPLSQFVT